MGVRECATKYNVSESIIRNMIRKGKIRSIRTGGGPKAHYIVDEQSAERWFNTSAHEGELPVDIEEPEIPELAEINILVLTSKDLKSKIDVDMACYDKLVQELNEKTAKLTTVVKRF